MSDPVTEILNPVQQIHDTPCSRCGGTGQIEVENAHEMEVWACPKCRPGIVGEVV